jgi:hypothetical protein
MASQAGQGDNLPERWPVRCHRLVQAGPLREGQFRFRLTLSKGDFAGLIRLVMLAACWVCRQTATPPMIDVARPAIPDDERSVLWRTGRAA